MTVAELITWLQWQPQDAIVSVLEQCMWEGRLNTERVRVIEFTPAHAHLTDPDSGRSETGKPWPFPKHLLLGNQW